MEDPRAVQGGLVLPHTRGNVEPSLPGIIFVVESQERGRTIGLPVPGTPEFFLQAAGDGDEAVAGGDEVAPEERLHAVLGGHEDGVVSAAFNPEGTRIFTGSSGGVLRSWDAARSELLASFVEHDSAISSIAFSPDGT